jgi:hypothetical protein
VTAPSVVLRRAAGIRTVATFFVQGIIVDSASPSGRAAVTNGIVVQSR